MAAYEPGSDGRRSAAACRIRRAGRDDCAAIAAIEAERDGIDPADARARCERQVDDERMLVLVATMDDDVVVGFGRAGPITQPDDAPAEALPDGWYLLGLVVVDEWRRHGIGRALTVQRIEWIAKRARSAYYFANARNLPSIDLHQGLGFVEVTRNVGGSGISFEGGEGVLCRLDLA